VGEEEGVGVVCSAGAGSGVGVGDGSGVKVEVVCCELSVEGCELSLLGPMSGFTPV
jgi:hypothetical protein